MYAGNKKNKQEGSSRISSQSQRMYGALFYSIHVYIYKKDILIFVKSGLFLSLKRKRQTFVNKMLEIISV